MSNDRNVADNSTAECFGLKVSINFFFNILQAVDKDLQV